MLQAGLKLVLDPASGDFRCLSGMNSCPVCVAEEKMQSRAQRFYLIFMNLNFVVFYFEMQHVLYAISIRK